MGSSKVCVVVVSSGRLRRENCKRTRHDSLFSPWKILIGPSDWEDHCKGKEGVERYRVHNLPNCSSCSGIYELGIAVPKNYSGVETSKLDQNHIVPVYLGQADNVRTRLQQYGREGAHLEKSNGELHDSIHQGPRLFSDTFSRGYSIVYRWAPMNDKRDAENAETLLLDTFDYAWNKGSNGVRRPNEIFEKLDKIASHRTLFPNVAKNLKFFHQKKKGIRIEACKILLKNKSNTGSNQEKDSFFSRIFKIGRSRPRKVSSRTDLSEDHASICGVALGHGSVCRRQPIEGRRRCAEHRGMKINGITSKLIAEGKFPSDDLSADSKGKDFFPICGVTLENGSVCDKHPIQGRKRCVEHKGRRITKSGTSITYGNCIQFPSETCNSDTPKSPFLLESLVINRIGSACGVNLENGTFCTRQPVKGRKRCKEHKGMRVTVSKI